MTSPFVHLHVHSEYSLSDGSIRIKELIQTIKKWGHTSVALTDHANLFGAIDFYEAACQVDVNPILGVELYTEGHLSTQNFAKKSGHLFPMTGAFHLVLLAKNFNGYKNLLKIISSSYDNRFEQLPITSMEMLKDHSEDLIVMTSCLKGELGYLLQCWHNLQIKTEQLSDIHQLSHGNSLLYDAIINFFESMKSLYSSNLYVELIDNNLEQQKRLLPKFITVANEFQVPLVASADAHYLQEDFREIHNLVLAVKNRFTIKDIPDRSQQSRFHLLDNKNMVSLFSQYPQALANSLKIAEQCRLDLSFGQYHLPNFPEPTKTKTTDDSLAQLTEKGLERHLQEPSSMTKQYLKHSSTDEYWKRLRYELGIIKKMGFAGYFLIVQDFIVWAKHQSIPVGPGRGSGAGSLVAYSLGITDLDPLPLNLIFERFLNPERISMPDFDIDFCQWRRDEVIRYVIDKYGKTRVAQIITFGRMQAKGALKSIGRALGMSYSKVDHFTKLVPNELNISLKKAIEIQPELLQSSEKDDELRDLLRISQKVEGICTHTSVHAAGIVIADAPISHYVPTYRNDENDEIMTQYEMKNAEKVGLIKFDFLGLKTLTVIDETVKYIQRIEPEFKINQINLEDRKVYKNISKAHTIGLFQLESLGMQQLIIKLKPSCFEDMIALVALFRPGPLSSGMVDDFIDRKHGQEIIRYPHPKTEMILKETYGVILYQEQVQKIAAQLANYSLGEADLLRRAMGKKKPKEMAKQRERFVNGCIRNTLSKHLAEEIFELMAKFAQYGFNKSHSAAYGLVSYQTAYLKTYYPEYFMASIMSCDEDNTDKIIRYIYECRRMGIHIHTPDINKSLSKFHVNDRRQIHFGLSAIKGLGEGMIRPIIQEREKRGPFTNLDDFIRRLDIQKLGKKNAETLMMAGAFDVFHYPRQQMIHHLDAITSFSQKLHLSQKQHQRCLFDSLSKKTLSTHCSARYSGSPWQNWKIYQRQPLLTFEELDHEKNCLGTNISAHPLDFYSVDKSCFCSHSLKDLSIKSLQTTEIKTLILLVVFNKITYRKSKFGKELVYLNLEDQTSREELLMLKKDFSEELPKIGDILIIHVEIFHSQHNGKNFQRIHLKKCIKLDEYRQERVDEVKLEFMPEDPASSFKPFLQSLKQLISQYSGTTNLRFSLFLKKEKASVVFNKKPILFDLCNDFIYKFRKLSYFFDIKFDLKYLRK